VVTEGMILTDLPLVDIVAAAVDSRVQLGNLVRNIAGQTECCNTGEERQQELGCTEPGVQGR